MKNPWKSITLIMRNVIIITFCLLGIVKGTSAQDIITLKTGEEIKAKVNQVDLNVIKYTKYDNQTGPVYTFYKADVFMIKYENGSKDVFDFHEETPSVSPSQNESETQAVNGGKLTCIRGIVVKQKQRLTPYEVKATMKIIIRH